MSQVENEAIQSIVVDNGSGMVKAGLSGNDAPTIVFPSIIGTPLYPGVMIGMGQKAEYLGDEAQAKRGVLNIRYPIEHGIVQNWDCMTSLWHHTFYNELRVNPSEYHVLCTEAPKNPKANREKMAEIAFETFNFKGFFIAVQAVLSLYASGKTTGLVVDSGDGVTHVVPVFEGYALPHAVERINLAGRDVTCHLRDILAEIGVDLTSSAELEICKDLKEKLAYVSLDYEKDMVENKETIEATLPDGNMLQLGSQLFRAPEILFNPRLCGKELPGITQLIQESIKKSANDIRNTLYNNVVISGGTTMLRNFSTRLENELKKGAPNEVKVNVTAPQERKFSVWIGGSILSSLSTFSRNWVSKEEYEENPRIIHSKCV